MEVVSDGLFANWRPTPFHSVSLHFNTFLPTNWIRRAAVAYLMVPTTILDYVMYGNCIGRFVRQLAPDPVSLCFSSFQYLFARKLNIRGAAVAYLMVPAIFLDWCTGILSDGLFANGRPTPFHSVSLHFNTFLPTDWIRRAAVAYLWMVPATILD